MPKSETVEDTHPAAAIAGGERNGGPGIGSYLGTVALVGLGLAFIEEELLAGMAVGVAAMAFPRLIPRLSTSLRPLMKSAVRTGYGVAARTRETVAEMSEEFQDIIAEVRAEQEHGPGWGATAGAEAAHGAPAEQVLEHAESERGKGRKSGKTAAETAETPAS